MRSPDVTADVEALLGNLGSHLPDRIVVLRESELLDAQGVAFRVLGESDALVYPMLEVRQRLKDRGHALLDALPEGRAELAAAVDAAAAALGVRLVLLSGSTDAALLPAAGVSWLDLKEDELVAATLLERLALVAELERRLGMAALEEGAKAERARSAIVVARERQVTIVRRLLKKPDDEDLDAEELRKALTLHEPRNPELLDIRSKTARQVERAAEAARRQDALAAERAAVLSALRTGGETLAGIVPNATPDRARMARAGVRLLLRKESATTSVVPSRRGASAPAWLRTLIPAGAVAAGIYGISLLGEDALRPMREGEGKTFVRVSRGATPPPDGSTLPEEAPADASLRAIGKNVRARDVASSGKEVHTLATRYARIKELVGDAKTVVGRWGLGDDGKHKSMGILTLDEASDETYGLLTVDGGTSGVGRFKYVFHMRKPDGSVNDQQVGYVSDLQIDRLLADFEIVPMANPDQAELIPSCPGDPRVVGNAEGTNPVMFGGGAGAAKRLMTVSERAGIVARMFRDGRTIIHGSWLTRRVRGIMEAVEGRLELVHEDDAFYVVHAQGLNVERCDPYDYVFHILKPGEPWKDLSGRASDVHFDDLILRRFLEDGAVMPKEEYEGETPFLVALNSHPEKEK